MFELSRSENGTYFGMEGVCALAYHNAGYIPYSTVDTSLTNIEPTSTNDPTACPSTPLCHHVGMCWRASDSWTRYWLLGHDHPKWWRLEQKRTGQALWSLVTPCRDGGASGAIDEGPGCWDSIIPRSRGPSDTKLASVLMPSHKVQ
jgi:hypothetical protein